MIAFATAYAGFLALALAMPNHFARVFPGHRPNTPLRAAFRAAGVAALAGSALASSSVWSAAFAAVAWPGILTAAGLLLVLLLALRPRLAAAPLALTLVALLPG